jgi:S-adenosylmethionine:tRNA ribosyltransferase-isomerase
LLCLKRDSGRIEHRQFADVVDLMMPGDLLILNDTRVSALRLEGFKPTGGHVEALLLSGGPLEFDALLRPGKRLKPGAVICFGDLTARVVADLSDGLKRLRFDPIDGLAERIREHGQTPLPPYIHAALNDPERYQTVYGDRPGSAAAPTAGLHFTQEILSRLEANGVKLGRVTLHVGLDTFRPVQSEDLDEHAMHGERCEISVETAAAIANCRGRVIAVGTTAVRTLESFADQSREVRSGEMLSRLFIRPGYRFKVIDGMFTNFHLPKTTMMMMISALAGRERVLAAYDAAVHEKYRFLSFGDSMLIM